MTRLYALRCSRAPMRCHPLDSMRAEAGGRVKMFGGIGFVSCRIQGALQTASGLEFRAGDAALPDDREKSTDGELRVIRNRDCDRPCLVSTLHHYMTAASPYLLETVFLEDLADVPAGKGPEFTHAPLRSAL